MVAKAKRDRLIGRMVKMLFEAKANEWAVQDKGVLLAAIKLQLRERKAEAQDDGAVGRV